MERRFGSAKLRLNLMIFYVSNLVQIYFIFKFQMCQRKSYDGNGVEHGYNLLIARLIPGIHLISHLSL